MEALEQTIPVTGMPTIMFKKQGLLNRLYRQCLIYHAWCKVYCFSDQTLKQLLLHILKTPKEGSIVVTLRTVPGSISSM